MYNNSNHVGAIVGRRTKARKKKFRYKPKVVNPMQSWSKFPNPDLKRVHIFTDGSYERRQNVGGWAALMRYGDAQKIIYGHEYNTTSQRMELHAAIYGLSALNQSCSVKIVTDSRYLEYGINAWMTSWQRNGWRTADGRQCKNVDLWNELFILSNKHQIICNWVKGHSGHPENTVVDKMAREAMQQRLRYPVTLALTGT